MSYQWRHVATVHLTHGDLLLRGRHGAHAGRLGANRAKADHSRQRHRALVHLTHTVKLLLKYRGSARVQHEHHQH